MRTILTFSVLILALCIGCPQPAPPTVPVASVVTPDLDDRELTFDGSWTIFHGPNRDNRSPDTGLLQSWSEGGPPLLWKASGIGTTEFPGYSSVTVADGRVFTAGNIRTGETDRDAHVYVFALDERTGEELWRYRNGGAWVEEGGRFPGERSTPTIDGDRVYAFSALGRVVCLEVATGNEIWARDLREEYAIELPHWGFAESPYIDGNKIILWISSPTAAVVALDKMSGETIWETPNERIRVSTEAHPVAIWGTPNEGVEYREIYPRGGYASMIAFDHGGQRIYVNTNQKGFLGVNAETGARLFYIPHETAWDVLATTPYFFDGNLFITSGYGAGARLYRLNVEGDAVTPERVWANDFDNQHHSIVIKDGYAYGTTHNHRGGRNWTSIRLADGSVAWENPGVLQGSAKYADGMLYCVGDREGYVALVRATPERYEEVSRFRLPDAAEGGGVGPFWAHPVVVNKKLFIRHGTFLYCFDIAER